jgi:hypothetical protein
MRNHEQMTVRAADLAERLVDEISQSDQDWSAIERHARKLVELLARRSDGQARAGANLDDHGDRREPLHRSPARSYNSRSCMRSGA